MTKNYLPRSMMLLTMLTFIACTSSVAQPEFTAVDDSLFMACGTPRVYTQIQNPRSVAHRTVKNNIFKTVCVPQTMVLACTSSVAQPEFTAVDDSLFMACGTPRVYTQIQNPRSVAHRTVKNNIFKTVCVPQTMVLACTSSVAQPEYTAVDDSLFMACGTPRVYTQIQNPRSVAHRTVKNNIFKTVCVPQTMVLACTSSVAQPEFTAVDDSLSMVCGTQAIIYDSGLWATSHGGLQPEFIAADDSLKFRLHEINKNSFFSACAVIDVNHDGLLDVVSGGFWYEAPTWKQHFVREVEVINGRPDGYSHLELDVDRNGWTDLIHVNYRSKSIYWLQHPGPAMGEWKKHTVAEPGAMETGRLYDIDRDGQLDVLPNGWEFAAWYEILPAAAGKIPEWARYELPEQGAGHGNGFGDVNGDGRGDFIGITGWAEAPADAKNGTWVWHPEFDLGRTSIPIIVADVDEDGDNDLMYALGHDYGVYWEEQIIENGKRSWKKHLVDDSWSQGHSPLWVDLDGDGQNEFVNGKRFWSHEGKDPGARDPLVIYRYEFDKGTGKFNRYTIQANGPAGIGLDPKAADLDGDGDLDLVLPGRSGLYWYENLLISAE